MAFPVFCVPLCLLSRPGHFGVNGCSDECAPFTRIPTVGEAWVRVGWGLFYMCSAHSHTELRTTERRPFPNTLTVVLLFPHFKVLSLNM